MARLLLSAHRCQLLPTWVSVALHPSPAPQPSVCRGLTWVSPAPVADPDLDCEKMSGGKSKVAWHRLTVAKTSKLIKVFKYLCHQTITFAESSCSLEIKVVLSLGCLKIISKLYNAISQITANMNKGSHLLFSLTYRHTISNCTVQVVKATFYSWEIFSHVRFENSKVETDLEPKS